MLDTGDRTLGLCTQRWIVRVVVVHDLCVGDIHFRTGGVMPAARFVVVVVAILDIAAFASRLVVSVSLLFL